MKVLNAPEKTTSIITGRDRDCLSCRVIGGVGLMGIGLYIGNYARRNTTAWGKVTMFTLALGFNGLGIVRICNWPPFKK